MRPTVNDNFLGWHCCYPTAWSSERQIIILVYNDTTYLEVPAFPCLVLVFFSVLSLMLLCVNATMLEAEGIQQFLDMALRCA